MFHNGIYFFRKTSVSANRPQKNEKSKVENTMLFKNIYI